MLKKRGRKRSENGRRKGPICQKKRTLRHYGRVCPSLAEGTEGEEGEEGEDYPSVCIIKPLGLGPQPDLPSVKAELAAARSAGLAVGVTVLWGEMPL